MGSYPDSKDPGVWKQGDWIASGNSGKVYHGVHSTGKIGAIKKIELEDDNDKRTRQIEAVELEVKMLSLLEQHDNVVRLYAVQWSGCSAHPPSSLCDGRKCKEINVVKIIMEHGGNSLNLLLKQDGSLSEKTVVRYTRQLLVALEHCHKRSVVHRDLKSSNILINDQGCVKLTDFGSAKYSEGGIGSMSSRCAYTPLWAAPEVVITKSYSWASDIWSLGCVVIEMMSAKLPWSEKKFVNEYQALIHIGGDGNLPAIPDTLSSLGKDFVIQALNRDEKQRPTASQLLKHRWLRG